MFPIQLSLFFSMELAYQLEILSTNRLPGQVSAYYTRLAIDWSTLSPTCLAADFNSWYTFFAHSINRISIPIHVSSFITNCIDFMSNVPLVSTEVLFTILWQSKETFSLFKT